MGDFQHWLNELTCGEDARAEAAARQTAAQGDAALAVLETLLASPDADQRWWAARALAELRQLKAATLLVSALNDTDSAVRQSAALALEKTPNPLAISGLIGALQSRDSLLARLAANALVATGTATVPALLDALPALPAPARLEALRALALIGDPAAVPALYEACDGDSGLAEFWAAQGLERMGVGMVYFEP